ncbi:mucin-13-like [Notamacropus eugenii]|uniref:mucin-13-like n=1 Tax=Notamacropus eugenii TaxID=9315 RepID=UPI003B670964
MSCASEAATSTQYPKASEAAPNPNATSRNAIAPNATSPNATAPNATAPNATPPNVTAPNATAPTATAPNATAPTATAPNATAPNATAPTATAPNATAPNATAPNATAPNATPPNVTAPNATAPTATTPNATAPNATAPTATAPNATAPNSTAPNATAPTATTPNATAPNATPPNVTAPNATAPNATEPSPNATAPTPAPPSVPDPCAEKMCYGSSVCVALNNESFCLCPEGYYYKDSQCNQGRTFPGIITMSWNLSGLDDKTSSNYQNLHFRIEEFFGSAFADEPSFGQTIILNLQTFATARSEMRNLGQVKVTVTNIFTKNSTITLDEVNEAIENETNKDEAVSYQRENPCDFNGCDGESGDCSDGFQCKCREGLAKPFYPSSSCSVCSSSCNEQNHQQCIQKSDYIPPECQCLPGYMRKKGTCQKCDFGCSGVDCKDSYLLILTVVCVIGGAILLGTIIGLIVLASSKKKKKKVSEEDNLISGDFSNMRLETTGFSNPASSTGKLFPEVHTNQSSSIQSNVRSNPYEDPHFPKSLPAQDY